MILFKNKKIITRLAIILIFGLIAFGLPDMTPSVLAAGSNTADAGDLLDSGADASLDGWGPDVARWIITLALQLCQAIAGFVLGLGMALVDLTLSDKMYDQVFFAGSSVVAINTGWGLVRDFVNMFFILILIFVAIATILRVNKFSDKKFIVYVVSAALFVNFSKPITMFVIDISNLAMSFFMSNIREGNASYSAALLNAQGMGEVFKSDTQEANTMGMLVAWVVEIVFKFIMGIMLLGLGLSLIVRLIALWVLIILSPLAFFAMALPGTAIGSIKSTWFNKLTYWCFYGPIMLFFFWLALVLVSAIGSNVAFGDAELQMAGINKDHFIVGALKVFIPYASCIYMLFYGFDLSKKIAGSAGDGASWGLGKSMAMLGGTAMAAKWATSKTGRGLGHAATGFGYGSAAASNIKESVGRNRAAGALQRKASMPGGNLKSSEHKSNLVDEANKKWDKEGTPSKEKLEKIMKSKPQLNTLGNAVGVTRTHAEAEAERKAAAIKLADGGNLSMKDGSYERAVGLFKGDEKNLEKFKKAAEKKNRGAVIEHEIASTMKDSVDKDVLEHNTALPTPMSGAVEEAFRRNRESGYKSKVYEKHLGKMKLSDITEQSADFLSEDEVQKYIERRQAADDNRFSSKNIRKQAAENLDDEKQEALKKFF